jgi:hypothetical protein
MQIKAGNQFLILLMKNKFSFETGVRNQLDQIRCIMKDYNVKLSNKLKCKIDHTDKQIPVFRQRC